MSCKFCHDFDPRGHEEGFLLSLTELQEGCRFCSLLRNLARYFSPCKEDDMLDPFFRVDIQEGNVVNVELTVEDPANGPGSLKTLANFYVYSPSHLPIADLPALGTLGLYSLRSDSESCYRFIEERLQHCFRSHKKCIQPQSTFLPKRVLSIGASKHDIIRLVEPGQILARYAALSHCWGTHQPMKTTSSTLVQMKGSINWDDLSKVFQDAITVARRLRLQWIWIDSLCIIQDSKADWEIESSKMCDYYENAYITISASSAENGTAPFLRERERYWWPERFTFVCGDGTESHVMARQHQGSSMAQLLEDLGPLASRGWVWQEHVLSTRILHYTQAELIWECKSEVISEDNSKPRGFYSMGSSQKRLRAKEDPFHTWHYLLQSYSVRQLTFESDKLPAVIGVASRIHATVGSEYLAGLWKANMPIELCWSVDYISSHSSTPQLPPNSFIAPSWSWASVNGALSFVDRDPKTTFDALLAIVDVKCSVPGLNPYGKVTDGFFTVQGLVVPMTINSSNPHDCWTYTLGEDPDSREPMTPDCMLVQCQIDMATRREKETVRRARKGDILAPFSTQVYCLRLCNEDGEDFSCMYGMLIGLSDTIENAYTRLGLVTLDSGDWFEGAVESTIKII